MCDNTFHEHPSSTDHTVADFGCLPEESLHALGESLGLGMQPSQLASCSAYYRSVRRDPSIDELRLIDACITAQRTQATQTMTLSSLTSPDGKIADMLRSLIEQSKTPGGKTPPLTVGVALGASCTANASVALTDAKTGARLCLVTDEEYGALPMQGLRPLKCVCIGDMGVRLTLAAPTKAHENTIVHAGELIGLISLPDGASEAYFARLHTFFSDATNRRHIRALTVCPRSSLLSVLLDASVGGCYADTSVLCQNDSSPSYLEIAERARGYLVRANETDMKALVARARACGLELTVFARLCDDDSLTLAERDVLRASVSVTLLRSLMRTRIVSLELCAPQETAVHAESSRSLVSAANGWERVTAHPAGEPVALGDYTVMHTSLALQDALSPHDVTRAVMQCALELTAAGGDFDTMCTALSLSVGTQGSHCALWSAVLGAHHMLSEWRIPSLAPIIRSTDKPYGELTVCLFARTVKPPKTNASTAQLRIFALETDECGLPRPHMLAAMLSLTSRTLADGRIAGLRPLWGKGLRDALTTVKDLTLDDAVQQSPTLLDQAVFGLFVRADETVTQGTRLGSLAPAEQQDTPRPRTHALIQAPKRYSLIHRARPTVLLPILPTVDRPDTLIAYLGSLNAEIRPLPISLTHEDCTALADAIADADILVLNGDAASLGTMLEHRRVAYAIARHLTDRDGTLLAVHGAAEAIARQHALTAACSDGNRLILCPDGLTRDMLASAVAYYH